MPRLERVRESVSQPPTDQELKLRADAGWRLVAVEWEREAGNGKLREEIPFGVRVSEDRSYLEENPAERQVLVAVMESLVADKPFPEIAEELNRQGLRTRHGGRWTPVSVFNLLPRLVEVGPRIFTSDDWPLRRRRLSRYV